MAPFVTVPINLIFLPPGRDDDKMRKACVNSASPTSRDVLKVLFVTSEIGDYIKTGGLGEVSAALPRAMAEFADIRILIPGYRRLRAACGAIEIVKELPGHAELPPWTLGRTRTPDGLTIYVVLCDELYDRDGTPYGDGGIDFADNDLRFARLSRAAAEVMSGAADLDWKPDMLHANDWQSALAAGYMRWMNVAAPSILTIHNLAYQGLFDPARMHMLGIPDDAFNIDGVEFHGRLSFLKGGLAYASHLTTVSETYANEIATHEHGCGLEGILRQRLEEQRLTGILNGIDESWSEPSRLADDPQALARWKADHACRLRRQFGLSASNGPLFAIVSRLVHQKGIDLSIRAARTIVEEGGQLVVTGKGEPALEQEVEAVSRRFPGKVSAHIGFDNDEARLMFAGSDFLLMPSRFEPCGLSQMYAQSSAALPIASRTGGLVDTIEDGKSGFFLSNLSAASLSRSIKRGIGAFRSGDVLERMRLTAIAKPFGWTNSARRYGEVYAMAMAS